MIIAPNAQPPWPDVAGNLLRRFPILTFNHPVRHSDPHLFEKRKEELPTLLIKTARCYLEAVQEYGGRSLWEPGVLPQMCHEAKRQYLITSNPLSAFLASDQIIFQQHMETESSDFRHLLNPFTKDQYMCHRYAPRCSTTTQTAVVTHCTKPKLVHFQTLEQEMLNHQVSA